MEKAATNREGAACAFIRAHHTTLPYCNPRGMMSRDAAVGRRSRSAAVIPGASPSSRGWWTTNDKRAEGGGDRGWRCGLCLLRVGG